MPATQFTTCLDGMHRAGLRAVVLGELVLRIELAGDPDIIADFGNLNAALDEILAIQAAPGHDHAGGRDEEQESDSSDSSDASSSSDDGDAAGAPVKQRKTKDLLEMAQSIVQAMTSLPCCTAQCLSMFDIDSIMEELKCHLGQSAIQRYNSLFWSLKPLVPTPKPAVPIENPTDDNPAKRACTVNECVAYKHNNIVVCRTFFLKLHCLSPGTLQKCLVDVRTNNYKNLTETRGGARVHETSELVRSFLKQYSDMHGLPNPSGRGSRDGQPAVFLSITLTRKRIYDEYKEAMEETGNPLVQAKHFKKIWARSFPWLQIAKRKTDFCNTCTQMTTGAGANDPLQIKTHLEQADTGRGHIRGRIDISGTRYVAHWTFDFAQCVRGPLLVNQPKASYFHSGATLDFFGVADDANLNVWVYVLAETQWPDAKDTNTVCSMILHRLLTDPAAREITTLYLQADNCAGQNKNQYLFKFCAWLVVAARQLDLTLTTIEINFGIAGHTKNYCDASFGLIKRQLKKMDVLTPHDAFRAVRDSTIRTNIPKCGTEVTWYNIKAFVDALPYFSKKFPIKTTMIHHIEFSAATPGKVTYNDVPAGPWQTAQFGTDEQLAGFPGAAHALAQIDILPCKELTDARRAQIKTIVDCWKRDDITIEGLLAPARPP
jgi:hypothetical protein